MHMATRVLSTAALVFSVHAAASAAVVTDALGQASFQGCYYLTCIPGATGPVGLVASATSKLSFSPAADTFDTLGITVQATDPVEVVPAIVDGARTLHVRGLTATSVRRDDTADAFLGASLQGSFTLSAIRQAGLASGGSVLISGLKVDVVSQRITADISGSRLAFGAEPAEAFALSNVALWSFAQTAGPSPFDPASLIAVNDASLAVFTLSGLTLTSDGLAALTSGLGLRSSGVSALATQDWGSLAVDLRYGAVGPLTVPGVPEPSSWAMMGAGLVGLLLVRRRIR
jgi:hypothetical protein